MSKTYAVLGAGMQGTALAYDLAKFANPSKIFLGDMSLDQAKKSARRVNELIGSAICEPVQVSALDADALARFLSPVDVLCSCVPYWMHPHIAKVAIATKTNMVDLGGNTDVTMETLKMDPDAKAAGVSLIPDCGLAPGLVNSLACYIIENMDTVDSVKLYCGVLPQNPKPPFNYKLTFNMEGLVTEYDYQAVCLKDDQIVLVDTLEDLEEIHIDGLGLDGKGKMEAFNTSGGTSTAPYTFKGKVKNYVYKTIRFPGHCFLMKIFKDFGFWNEEAIEVKGTKIVPKDVFNAVFGPELDKFVDKDFCAVRALGVGTKDGKPKTIQIDILDKEDEVTGFTSMERLTGFSAAIYAHEIAKGNVPEGAIHYELAVPGTKYVEEIQQRGVKLTISEI
ncbi:MAG: saccharopine dehydrogenase NADP-binding domain-containing protein [Fimbriimonadaceae bacterium]|nr:saccharopine dehydrogenase NADP-binding domain-containing protein [Fimbriimonadaceae bacterium]